MSGDGKPFFAQEFFTSGFFTAWFFTWPLPVEPPADVDVSSGYAQQNRARANHIRRMQQIDEQDVEDIAMIFSLFRSMCRG